MFRSSPNGAPYKPKLEACGAKLTRRHYLERLVLALGDQQLVTDLTIVISAWAKRCKISSYRFKNRLLAHMVRFRNTSCDRWHVTRLLLENGSIEDCWNDSVRRSAFIFPHHHVFMREPLTVNSLYTELSVFLCSSFEHRCSTDDREISLSVFTQ